MRRTLIAGVVAAGVVLVVGGCSSLTEPEVVTDFQWTEVDPEIMEEGVVATVALGELFILGQVPTPTRCYRVDFGFEKRGSKLTLQIDATTSMTENCDLSPGGYRYTLGVYNLKSGTYELRVFHDVSGGQARAFTQTVTIR